MHIFCLQLEPHATSLSFINVDIWDGITELKTKDTCICI